MFYATLPLISSINTQRGKYIFIIGFNFLNKVYFMNNTLSFTNRIFMVLSFIILGVFSIGCDTNFAKPEDLTTLNISVGSFESSSSSVTIGDSTTLTWSVSDDDDLVNYVEISPDVGAVQMSGSKSVSPTVSTIYYLNVYVNDEVVRSRQISIKVYDLNDDEIVSSASTSIPESETECTDGIDDDQDGATDCDDGDCSEDDACVVEEETYEFYSVSVDNESPEVGDIVTVTWSSNFDIVKIDGYSESYEGEGSLEVEVEETSTKITLNGFYEGLFLDSETVTIEAIEPEEPEFSATIKSFTSSPRSVISGEDFTVSWSVENASVVDMDGHVTVSGALDYTAGSSNETFTLTVTDKNDLIETKNLTVYVSAFSSAGSVGSGNVSSMTPGDDKGEFYIIGSNGVYKTSDYGSTFEEISTAGTNGTISSIAEKNDVIYIGTDTGFYYRPAGSEEFVNLGATAKADGEGQQTITAIHILGSEHLLVGTDHMLFEVSSDFCTTDKEHGHCPQFKSFNSITDRESAYDSPTNFKAILKDPSDSNYIIAVTDQGVFHSDNKGETFTKTSLSNSVKGISWTSSSQGFIWTDHSVYRINGQGDFESLSDLSVTGTEINYVAKKGGRYFIATTSGIYTTNLDGDLFKTNNANNVSFLLSARSGGMVTSGSIANIRIGGRQSTIYSIDSTGSKQSLSFSANFSIIGRGFFK